MIRLVSMLRRLSLARFGLVVTLAVLAGGASALLVSVLGRFAATSHPLQLGELAGAVALSVGLSALSQRVLYGFSASALTSIRTNLAATLAEIPLERFERLGIARSQATLVSDVPVVARGIDALVPSVAAVTTLLASMGYLLLLSPKAFAPWLVSTVAAVLLYSAIARAAAPHLEEARKGTDRLFQGIRAVLEGAKEVRTSELRAQHVLNDQIDGAGRAVRDAELRAVGWETVSFSLGRSASFVTIGALAWLSEHRLLIPREVIQQYLLVTIFALSPAETLVFMLPLFARATHALDRLDGLAAELDAETRDGSTASTRPLAKVESLELHEVTHDHQSESSERAFRLGPISVRLHPGEVVFLVGGNGSGKTTLAKVVAGLYANDGGELVLNGERIDEANRAWYRRHVATVFLDYYLFDEYPEFATPAHTERAKGLLRELRLEDQVTFENGRFSTLALSAGQRKRLALVAALLADKPICLFDEWAADQDPAFRAVFYRSILPRLRAEGKLVVAVTHDERYWDAADQVLKLSDGRLTRDSTGEFILHMHGGWQPPRTGP